jgi:hypothetical protein
MKHWVLDESTGRVVTNHVDEIRTYCMRWFATTHYAQRACGRSGLCNHPLGDISSSAHQPCSSADESHCFPSGLETRTRAQPIASKVAQGIKFRLSSTDATGLCCCACDGDSDTSMISGPGHKYHVLSPVVETSHPHSIPNQNKIKTTSTQQNNQV